MVTNTALSGAKSVTRRIPPKLHDASQGSTESLFKRGKRQFVLKIGTRPFI